MGGGSNSHSPAVHAVSICNLSRRCHINGKGLRRFGTKFPQKLVSDLGSASVQLVTKVGGQLKRLASGTLIHPRAVLCAAHSVSGAGAGIEILMNFECETKTAPPGSSWQYTDKSKWSACNLLANTPQAKEVKTLEKGSSGKLDYALLEIEWNNTTDSGVSGTKVVELPRVPVLPVPGTWFSREVLVIGHPWVSRYKHNTGEPTQASAGQLVRVDGPNPENKKGKDYGYATFDTHDGVSGGGVYNQQGQIIGVLKGAGRVKINHPTEPGKQISPIHPCFLNLGRIKHRKPSSRIELWFQTLTPFFPREEIGNHIVFKKPYAEYIKL